MLGLERKDVLSCQFGVSGESWNHVMRYCIISVQVLVHVDLKYRLFLFW